MEEKYNTKGSNFSREINEHLDKALSDSETLKEKVVDYVFHKYNNDYFSENFLPEYRAEKEWKRPGDKLPIEIIHECVRRCFLPHLVIGEVPPIPADIIGMIAQDLVSLGFE
jgi:hypothetical protein